MEHSEGTWLFDNTTNINIPNILRLFTNPQVVIVVIIIIIFFIIIIILIIIFIIIIIIINKEYLHYSLVCNKFLLLIQNEKKKMIAL